MEFSKFLVFVLGFSSSPSLAIHQFLPQILSFMDSYKKITLKLLINKETNKVVFAESGEYFVQLLLSLLSFPLYGLSRGFGQTMMIGCIDALSKSAEALDTSYFRSEASKNTLCRPGWFCSTKFHCFVKMFGLSGNKCVCGIPIEQINLAIGSSKFIITDDLRVSKVSFETAGLPILRKFGIVDGSAVEEKIVTVGKKEVLELFKYSPLSRTPITDVFLKPEEIIGNPKRIKTEPLDMNPLPFDQTVLESIKKISLKLVVQKSQNKVLYAVANDEFVDLLFIPLAYPIQSMIELFGGCSSLGSMDNLYKSEENLCDENPENFKRYKKLFNPKSNGGFLKGPEIFMVTDELIVQPFSPVSSISFFTNLGVPLSDLEERIATVGEQEVRSILQASLTTTTALTNVFCKKN